jgi:hypothetical protein
MKKFILVLTSLFLAGCSVVGIRSASEPKYQILVDSDKIEIRQYPPMVVAQTVVNTDYKDSSSQGFNGYDGASHATKNPESMANGFCATPKLHRIISPDTFGFGGID